MEMKIDEMEFKKEELKEIVMSSYELLVKMPLNSGKKYEISSRNKLKNLPEALRENSDPDAAITHFVKHASYFLPRAEKKDKEDEKMIPFLYLLLEKVKKYNDTESNSEKRIKKIKYLVGYANWNADSVTTIFNASKSDDEIKKRLKTMLDAEFGIIDEKDKTEKIISDIMKWKERRN